jgi:uncharacterized iron-regulated membrane protein
MIRRYLVWQHRWIGLLMTVFLVTVGITGTLLAYKIPIDRMLNPRLYAKAGAVAKPLGLAELAERAEAIEPKARVWYYYNDIPDHVSLRCVARTNQATGKPYELDFDHLVLNPYTGDELGRLTDYGPARLSRESFMALVYQLHTSMLCGSVGWTVMGYVALAWTIDCFVGFYLTLPRGGSRFWGRWREAWRVKRGASTARVNFDLHRAGGLWLWPLLFVFAWSGVMLCLNDVYEGVTRRLFDYRSDLDQFAASSGRANGSPKLGWRAAEAKSAEIMAKVAETNGFTVEKPAGFAYIAEAGVYSYTVQSSLDFRRHPPQTGVWIDGDTGELRAVWRPSGEHFGNTLGSLLWALHYGDLHGWGWYRLLVAFTGLVIVMVSTTGVYIWWRKRGGRLLRKPRLIDARSGTA